MSYGLNSLDWDCLGAYIGVIKGDTRSLDHGSDEYGCADPLVPVASASPSFEIP